MRSGEPAKNKGEKTQSKTLQYHKSSRLWLHASHCPEHSVTRLKIQWKCLSINTGAIFIYQCDRSERQRERERAFWAHCLWRVFSDLCSSKTVLLTCHELVCVGLKGLHSQSCAVGYQPDKKEAEPWTSKREYVHISIHTLITEKLPNQWVMCLKPGTLQDDVKEPAVTKAEYVVSRRLCLGRKAAFEHSNRAKGPILRI